MLSADKVNELYVANNIVYIEKLFYIDKEEYEVCYNILCVIISHHITLLLSYFIL